jgi:hypothetical protein
MFKLRNPFVYVGKKPKLTKVGCFSCSADIWLTQENMRVINYCVRCR